MARNDEPFELEGSVIIRTTRKAVLVRTGDMDEVWIPRSCCIDGEDLEEGNEDVSVQSWWAEQEELG